MSRLMESTLSWLYGIRLDKKITIVSDLYHTPIRTLSWSVSPLTLPIPLITSRRRYDWLPISHQLAATIRQLLTRAQTVDLWSPPFLQRSPYHSRWLQEGFAPRPQNHWRATQNQPNSGYRRSGKDTSNAECFIWRLCDGASEYLSLRAYANSNINRLNGLPTRLVLTSLLSVQQRPMRVSVRFSNTLPVLHSWPRRRRRRSALFCKATIIDLLFL